MQISNAQSRAIAHKTGPAMVLAGPGSGKTLVITQRTKYLIEQCGVDPQRILVITFTKAAAQEMRSRFFAASKARGVTFGTFHAVFFAILKQAYHYTAANILTEDQKYQILRQLVREQNSTAEEEKDLLSEIAMEISLVKNEQIDLEHYYSKSLSEDRFRTVFRQYEQMHREHGLIDFDDMMTYTKELLTARPDILAAWQRQYQYILVDEFQDINLLQYEILKLLAAPDNNLFIVGDDDQSIYRFRGANPEIMLNFPKEYPDAEKILLDQNFRCVSAIVRDSIAVIEQNEHRFKKQIRAVRSGGGIEVKEFDHQDHESLYLVKKVEQLIENGTAPSEIAVLFRTNQGAGPFAQRLIEFNIPFEMRDALPNIYDHWIAQDLFAYLHLALVQTDRKEFLQIMNRPKRYISRDSIDTKIISFETLRTYYEEKDWMIDRIDRMELDLKLLRQMTPFAAVNYIRHGIHYEEYLQEYAKARRMKLEDLTDILDEIQQSAKPFRTFEEWYEQIDAFREKLKEQRGKKKETNEDAITLATLHSSKGLEFEEVFLTDINEGIIPHRKASVEADLEEERRLFYVGMTRAKNHLHLYYVKERYGKEMEPSPFLDVFLNHSYGQ